MKKIMHSKGAVLKAFRSVYLGNTMLAKMRCAALAACIYHIWIASNRLLFENEKPCIQGILKTIKINLFRCVPGYIDVFNINA